MTNIEPILIELATKLGTTMEQLWRVLIKQAVLDAAIDLFIILFLLFFAYKVFVFVKDKTTPPPKTKENNWPTAEWEDEDAAIAWGGVGIIGLLVFIFIISVFKDIMTGFFNPQYYALKMILNLLRKG